MKLSNYCPVFKTVLSLEDKLTLIAFFTGKSRDECDSGIFSESPVFSTLCTPQSNDQQIRLLVTMELPTVHQLSYLGTIFC